MGKPLQAAREAWQKWDPTGDFTTLLAGYLAQGFVYSGDDAFILAMPQGDTWFVHLAAGKVSRFQSLAPYPLRKVAWQRGGKGPVRSYSWDRFLRLTL